MFRFGAIIAEMQSGGNLCWAAQCISLRVLGEIISSGQARPTLPTVAIQTPTLNGTKMLAVYIVLVKCTYIFFMLLLELINVAKKIIHGWGRSKLSQRNGCDGLTVVSFWSKLCIERETTINY